MALIKCKECKKEISDKAKVCPHCGYENNIITCPECKKEIENNVNTCPNCGYEIKKENKQVKSKFNVGIMIWLVICVIACFGMAFLNFYTKMDIGDLEIMPCLAILLGVAYIVLLANKNKVSLYILLGVNAIVLLYNLLSIGMFISLLNIGCALINSIITLLVVRKGLNNNKLNLLGIISYIAVFVVILGILVLNFSNSNNDSNGLDSTEQYLFNTIVNYVNDNDFYNPSAVRVLRIRPINEENKEKYPIVANISGTNKFGGTINKCYMIFSDGIGGYDTEDCDFWFMHGETIPQTSIQKINKALEKNW